MKEYIYQDERLMQSLISQHSGGFLKSISTSNTEGKMDGTTETIRGAETAFQAKAGIGIVGAQIEATRETTDRTYSATHDQKGSVSHYMDAYDHAYDEFESVLLQYEGFCKFEDVFRLVDLEVISATVESELIKESALQAHDAKINLLESSNNRDQRRTPAYTAQLSKLKKEKDDLISNFERTKGLTAYATHILPSTCFLLNKEANAMFPLIKRSLILEPNQVSFYYKNTKTHMLAKRAGSLKKNLGQDEFMAGFYGALEQAIISILNIFEVDDDTELYMPISWYEEHSEVD